MADSAKKIGLGRDFWLYQFGQAVSIVGDACGSIALAWWVLEKTGSAVVMSSILAPAMVARIFLMPLFGPLGDRFARKRLMFSSDLWRGALSLILASFVIAGYFELPAVIAIYILTAVGTALFQASAAILPQLVPPERLQDAYRQSQALQSTGNIVGGIVGGILVSALGVKGAFLIDAVSFFVAAFSTLMIRAETTPLRAVVAEGHPIRVWARDLTKGFQTLYRIPVLFWLCIVAMVMNFVMSPLSVVLPVLVKESRGMPPWFLGALESSVGAGSVVGALGLGWLAKRLKGDSLILLGITLTGLGVAFAAWIPNLYLPLTLMFLVGVGGAWANTPLGTQISLSVPDSYRARIGSIMMFMCMGIAPLGVAFAGALITWIGLTATMAAGGALMVALGPLLLVVPRFREFMRADPAAASTFMARHYPTAFDSAPESGSPEAAVEPAVAQ